jgi:hypothetical protein
MNCFSFVEFETAADLKSAVEKLDGREFKGVTVNCTPDVRHSYTHLCISDNHRFKTNVRMLEAIASDHLLVAATMIITTAVVHHRHLVVGVHEDIVSAHQAEVVHRHQPTTTMHATGMDVARPRREAITALPRDVMTTPTTLVAPLLRRPVDTRIPMLEAATLMRAPAVLHGAMGMVVVTAVATMTAVTRRGTKSAKCSSGAIQ